MLYSDLVELPDDKLAELLEAGKDADKDGWLSDAGKTELAEMQREWTKRHGRQPTAPRHYEGDEIPW